MTKFRPRNQAVKYHVIYYSAISRNASYSPIEATLRSQLIQSNLVIRNVLIRNKLVLWNHFPWPNANLLHKNKELLALRNNFRVTKMFLFTKFDCIWRYNYPNKHMKDLTKIVHLDHGKIWTYLNVKKSFCTSITIKHVRTLLHNTKAHT